MGREILKKIAGDLCKRGRIRDGESKVEQDTEEEKEAVTNK